MNHISEFIDHTLLKPDSVYGDYTNLCREAIEYKFYSVCVNSFYVPLVSRFLRDIEHDHKVKVCSVVGFPLGLSSIISKLTETNDAISNGATEIDVVVNISALKSGDYKRVKDELRVLKDLTKENILKVILEVGLLTEEQIKIGCELCIETNVDFVKTSTGFNVKLPIEETAQHVKLIKEFLKGSNLKIKASGGIKTLSDVQLMLQSGADRIGTSNSVSIMKELEGE